jgi:hypothetical protein
MCRYVLADAGFTKFQPVVGAGDSSAIAGSEAAGESAMRADIVGNDNAALRSVDDERLIQQLRRFGLGRDVT